MTKNLLYIVLAALMLVSCDWLREEYSETECPPSESGLWIKFTYAYNMQRVDKAPEQTSDIHLLITKFDNEEVVLEKVFPHEELLANDMSVYLGKLAPGEYTLIAWSGLEDSRYVVADGKVTLVEPYQTVTPLSRLFFGRQVINYGSDPNYAQHVTLDMMKDVNDIRITLNAPDKDRTPDHQPVILESREFMMRIVDDNTVLQYSDNAVIPTGGLFTYLPYKEEVYDPAKEGNSNSVCSTFSLMRLMENHDARIVIDYVGTTPDFVPYELANISLTSYLVQTLLPSHREMDAQELLDREDGFDVIIFLDKTTEPDRPYIVMNVLVKDWNIRPNAGEIE